MPIQPETSEHVEQPIRESTPILEESVLETTTTSQTEASLKSKLRKRKLVRDRNIQRSPLQPNLQMYLEKLNESGEIQNNATPTSEEDPNVITLTDKNVKIDLTKIEQIENTNQDNNNELTTRKVL